MSTVPLMPGRRVGPGAAGTPSSGARSASVTSAPAAASRTTTGKLVTACDVPAFWMRAELAISTTAPRSASLGYASTSTRAESPNSTFTTSFSLTSISIVMASSRAMRISSVPLMVAVPTTRSPSSTLSWLTVPDMGA